jgi:hypothetical protein
MYYVRNAPRSNQLHQFAVLAQIGHENKHQLAPNYPCKAERPLLGNAKGMMNEVHVPRIQTLLTWPQP